MGGGSVKVKLKAPYPWFGGKSRVAGLVWERLGDVDNYLEPFFGSGAVLILRPHQPRIETVNDKDVYVANLWRATQHDPDAVASFADGPVNEACLHARHRWLVLSDDAKAFRQRMRTDPDYFDAKIAGWWCWGLCCWIGSGWCDVSQLERNEAATPALSGSDGHGQGVVRSIPGQDNRKPRLDGGENQYGHGVHAKGEKRVKLSGGADGAGSLGTGVHQGKRLQEKRPRAHRAAGSSDHPCDLPGVLAEGMHDKRPSLGNGHNGAAHGVLSDGGRPQLADAYDIGRGVNSNGALGTCEQRRAWLLDWFGRLRDRFRNVRVCCGDWSRVCDSDSVTTRLGTTGIFFDPPYGAKANRNAKLYSTDSLTVADDVRAYCLERGDNPLMRICLAGYAGEGHEILEQAGWQCEAWAAAGGYGNRSKRGKENAKKERLWFSPACQQQQKSLF